jgi:penicillin G amidase
MTTASAERLTCPGLDGPLTIRRDAYGIAHVEAATAHDAWFGQGFVAAQDRLWQMEYDRRRAVGRWSEAAGPSGIAADLMARRLGIEAAAKQDLNVMAADVRAMFEAYAAGVNAYLASDPVLPPEYALTGVSPELWEPWQSLAVFKIRHVLMGEWQWKMAVGGLLARVGFETFRTLDFLPAKGTATILPPGGVRERELYDLGNVEIAACAEQLGFLSEIDGGSNSWVVSGSRTTTGKPVICNDSHRALDVPNAYWQVHLECPEFNIAGATFAGFPGFPHFGWNGSVSWNITHTQADYQDLYVERFEGGNVLTGNGAVAAERRDEVIKVRGGDPVTITCWRTPHGPFVHGDPTSGRAISLRYTALDGPRKPFDGLMKMVASKTVDELFDAQRTWVDPVNNLVAADTSGNIGYMVRGEIPVRSSTANRIVPAPGWTGDHEWVGTVPFEDLPRSVNPPEGYYATANNRVIDGNEPYISEYYASPARANRLNELLYQTGQLAPATIASWQGDVTSLPARAIGAAIGGAGPFTGDAERARAMLANFDGDLRGERPEPLLYAYARRYLMREIWGPIVGPETWAWLTGESNPGLSRILSGLLSVVVAHPNQPLPGGRTWNEVLEPALAAAWESTVANFGPDPAAWRWDTRHATGSKHTLAAAFPDRAEGLNPPSAAVGGDGDTLQCAGYTISGKNDFVIAALSVYRQVVDFADPDSASWIIPAGISGNPDSDHYADQLPLWQHHQRVPMHRTDAREHAEVHTELRPS